MVSVIAGIRKAGETIGSVLAACMPGGSITGAPKRRAMEIIEELESSSRGPYCGSIGYVSYGDRAEFNIAIRTGVVNEDAFCFWAGGGIVSDSVAQDEYQESQTKAQAYLRLFESATTN